VKKLTHVLWWPYTAVVAQPVVPKQIPIAILLIELSRHHSHTGLPSDPVPSSSPWGAREADWSFS